MKNLTQFFNCTLPGIVRNDTLLFLLRLCLGGIFIVSALTKIPDLKEFVAVVSSYNLLPGALSEIYAYTLPWAELGPGCFADLGQSLRWSVL